jgi:hypothetical protein
VSRLHAQTKELIVGSQNEGTHTHLFRLFAIASYTSRMLSSPLGTAKNLMKDLMGRSVVSRYLLLITFPIFSLVFARIPASAMMGCFPFIVGPGDSKKMGIPSRAICRYLMGKRRCTSRDPSLNSNHMVCEACQSILVIACWSQPSSVDVFPPPGWRQGTLHQSSPWVSRMYLVQSRLSPRINHAKPNFRNESIAVSLLSFMTPGVLIPLFQRKRGISASSALTAYANSFASSTSRRDSR